MRAAKRLLYIWDADYPWDVRTQKICASLVAEGWQVHLAARNRQRRALLEELPEATVHRMPIWPIFNDSSGFPAFCNPRWLRFLDRLVRASRPQVLMVRDLPLCPAAIQVGRRHAVPVVLDMAENYPAMIEDIWRADRQRPWDWLVRNPRLVSAVERWALPRVDAVLAVVEESAERIVRECRVERERVAVVSNTPPRARARQGCPRPAQLDGPLEVVYLGLMEIPRGVGELIDAIAVLRDQGAAVHARLIGDGRDAQLLRERAARLQLHADQLEFTGYLPNHEALRLVATADVGVVPHHATASWNSTIPNKLFDYMAAGLAVISSDTIPCARVLRSCEAGLLFRSGDARDLARALLELRDPGLRMRLTARARRAILEQYNWENAVNTLVNMLERMTAPDLGGARVGRVGAALAITNAP